MGEPTGPLRGEAAETGDPASPARPGDAHDKQAQQPLADKATPLARLVSARRADARRTGRRRVLEGLGISVLSALLAASIFLAGNLGAHTGIADLSDLLGLTSSRTQGAASAEGEVAAAQLAARLEEAAALLDADALYRYTQGDLDAATTEAIRALIATSGDPYAEYYTSEEYAAYLRGSEGEYSGIGVVLTLVDGAVTVLQVYEGSPAFDAGVATGDVLVAVDGQRREWTVEEAAEAISRSADGEVTIVWRRGSEERETTLSSRAVSVPTIVTHLIERDGQAVGYIYLRRFNTQSAGELSEALVSLEAQGARSYVLDLRGNPGGYLSQAIDVTSLFVPTGAVVQIEDRRGTTIKEVTGKTVTDRPLAVLVNGSSASASELVAAALADHGRATIVGEGTYGKGTVQDIRKLSWGGALKYTIAHYLSPNGTVLDGVGITPDVVVSLSAGAEGEPGAGGGAGGDDGGAGGGSVSLSDPITSSAYRYEQGADPQLDAALAAVLAETTGG